MWSLALGCRSFDSFSPYECVPLEYTQYIVTVFTNTVTTYLESEAIIII